MWEGEFGDRYVERNQGAGEQRGLFWGPFLRRYPVQSALEVGVNIGLNLEHIATTGARVVGADVNQRALERLRERIPTVGAVRTAARQLPFRKCSFELVFTAGVLIHQPQESLDDVMRDIVRCSSHYVLCVEYYAAELTEVPYRGQPGSLFKLDFGARYLAVAPDLRLLWRVTPPVEYFGDEMTTWMFERS